MENNFYLQDQLITYIGNKRKLLGLIDKGLQEFLNEPNYSRESSSFFDVFSGSGVVARHARNNFGTIITNDMEKYSCVINNAYQKNYDKDYADRLHKNIDYLNEIAKEHPVCGTFTDLYAPKDEENISLEDRVFYTRKNAMFIDTILYEIDFIDPELHDHILALLMYKASVHVNTSGVFKGFYKSKETGVGKYGGDGENSLQRIKSDIFLPYPHFSNYNCQSIVINKEASEAIKNIEYADVAYFDPPYNQHPYGSNYFMLNAIIDGVDKENISKVSGIPKDWNRSDYNVRNKAKDAFGNLLKDTNAKYLLISYNSEGFITMEDMLDITEPLGDVEVFDQEYNTFRGCRNLENRPKTVTELLFKVKRDI